MAFKNRVISGKLSASLLAALTMTAVYAPHAYAATPSIQLSVSSLQYGYSGPVTIGITGTGTNFNSTSIVYVLNGQTDTQKASGFQETDATHVSFTLGSGLGNAASATSYSVEVKTVEAGGALEVTNLGTLTVSGVTTSISPQFLTTGYADGSTVSVTLGGMNVSTATSVSLVDAATQAQSFASNIKGHSVQGNTISVQLNQGLAAGNYLLQFTDPGYGAVSVPLKVVAPSYSITTSVLKPMTAGQSYSDTLVANPSTVAWSVANLPTWLALNTSTGALTGMPPQNAQSVTLQVTATPVGGGAPIQKSIVLPLSSTLSITTTSLPAATQGSSYAGTLAANQSGVTWSASGLPAWLSLNSSTGQLSGTVPSDAKNATVQFTAKTSGGAIAVQSFALTVSAAATPTQPSGNPTPAPSPSGSTSGGSSSSTGGTTSSFPTIVGQQTFGATGGTMVQAYGGSTISVDVSANAFATPTQVEVTTTDASKLSNLPTGSTPVVAFGVSFGSAVPHAPITLTIKNGSIPAGAVVYKVAADGTLVPVQAVITQGQAVITFTADPNFVIVTPAQASTGTSGTGGGDVQLTSGQRALVFNGKTSVVPAFVKYGTTYMPIWYVMNSLKGAGILSKWDGTHWDLTVSNRTVNLSAIHAGNGKMDIYLNGKLVQEVNGIYAKDPTTGHLTTYMPVWYVMQVLKRANVTNTWDGTHWVLSTGQ